MFTVELLTEAEFEINEACQWYDAKQLGLAKRFVDELDHYFELISQNPFQFPVKFPEIYRFAVLQVFPYFVVYRIDERRRKVYVISVFNTYRNPESL